MRYPLVVFLVFALLGWLPSTPAHAQIRSHVVVSRRPAGSFPQCGMGHEPYMFTVTFKQGTQTGQMTGLWCKFFTADLNFYGMDLHIACSFPGVHRWRQGWTRAYNPRRNVFFCQSAKVNVRATVWPNNTVSVG